MNVRLASAAAAVALAAAGPAGAAIFIDAAAPYPPSPDENVLLDSSAPPASTVIGFTNQTHTQVNFLGTESLVAPSGGQARIVADDGALTYLDITPEDPAVGFSALEFNLDAMADGAVTFTLYDQDNNPFVFNETLDQNGSNFFSFTTAENELIVRAILSSSVELSDVGQVRLTTAAIEGGGPIPEPGAWGMMILGFFGAGAMVRDRRRRLSRMIAA